MPEHHWIVRLSVGGGPAPLHELEQIIAQSEPADGLADNRTAWFGTRGRGADWMPRHDRGPCWGLILAPPEHGVRLGVLARIVGRGDEIPDDRPDALELYADHLDMAAWWELADPRWVRFAGDHLIPGTTRQGGAIEQAFRGRSALIYWRLDDADVPPPGEDISVQDPHAPQPSHRRSPPPPSLTATPCPQPPPRANVPLYGVDFSGAAEDKGFNNALWIAEWQPGSDIQLYHGANGGHALGLPQPGFRRDDLAKVICKRPGWWTIDFPFGIPSIVAQAFKLDPQNHDAWLEMCAAHVGQATELRDDIRNATNGAGIAWSARRGVDVANNTTWFPLFEQLYRQTMYGAGQVLHPLLNCQKVRLLPWQHARANATAHVAEGFPGLRCRLEGMHATGYKGPGDHRQVLRAAMLGYLVNRYNLPLPEDARNQVIHNIGGDALDALMLVISSWYNATAPAATWENAANQLHEEGRLVEGWFCH